MTPTFKNKLDVFIATTTLLLFIILSAVVMDLNAEGGIGNREILRIILGFTSCLFPLPFLAGRDSVSYIILFAVNLFLYPLTAIAFQKKITVRIRRYKPFMTTYYTLVFIMIIVFLCFLFQLVTG